MFLFVSSSASLFLPPFLYIFCFTFLFSLVLIIVFGTIVFSLVGFCAFHSLISSQNSGTLSATTGEPRPSPCWFIVG